METQEIEKKLKAIIADKFGVAEADITSESSYTGDLGADSLDFVELIMEVKNVFGIKVADTKENWEALASQISNSRTGPTLNLRRALSSIISCGRSVLATLQNSQSSSAAL